ncbi:hypothetical protein ACFWPY_35265 [Streptomyces sp. NPDC058527]
MTTAQVHSSPAASSSFARTAKASQALIGKGEQQSPAALGIAAY